MSIARRMHTVMLQKRTLQNSPTGAKKYVWGDDGTIDAAIWKTNDLLNTQSVRYNESTHTGLTWEKDIGATENRLQDGDVIYEITSADTLGRRTTLLLKVVNTDV